MEQRKWDTGHESLLNRNTEAVGQKHDDPVDPDSKARALARLRDIKIKMSALVESRITKERQWDTEHDSISKEDNGSVEPDSYERKFVQIHENKRVEADNEVAMSPLQGVTIMEESNRDTGHDPIWEEGNDTAESELMQKSLAPIYKNSLSEDGEITEIPAPERSIFQIRKVEARGISVFDIKSLSEPAETSTVAQLERSSPLGGESSATVPPPEETTLSKTSQSSSLDQEELDSENDISPIEDHAVLETEPEMSESRKRKAEKQRAINRARHIARNYRSIFTNAEAIRLANIRKVPSLNRKALDAGHDSLSNNNDISAESQSTSLLKQLRRASPLKKGYHAATGHYSLLQNDEAQNDQAETQSSQLTFSIPQNYSDFEQAELLSEQMQDLGLMQEDNFKPTASLRTIQLAESRDRKARIGQSKSQDTGNPVKPGVQISPDPVAVQDEELESKTEDLYFGDIDNLRTAEDGICSNIHILGTGNIGKFVAHSLAGMVERPQITLLLHRPLRIQEWYDEGQAITMYTKGEPDTRTGFEVESSSSIPFDLEESHPAFGPNLETSIIQPDSIIDHLIVTTKATKILSAIDSVKSRLRPTSTICFIHNGMGVMDQINEEIFPNPVTRPNIIVGTISHGVGSVSTRKFSSTYNGNGVINLCYLDRHYSPLEETTAIRRKHYGYPPSVRYLARTLTRCTNLQAAGFSYNDFLILQLEKLAVNAVINPLSVIYDCTNGDLLSNHSIRKTMSSLLQEISQVFLALPELNTPKIYAKIGDRESLERKFSPKKLENLVVGVAEKTGKNFSSMLQDVRRGEKTEIEFINGYVGRRGREVGVDTPINDFVCDAVTAKVFKVKSAKENFIPFKSAI